MEAAALQSLQWLWGFVTILGLGSKVPDKYPLSSRIRGRVGFWVGVSGATASIPTALRGVSDPALHLSLQPHGLPSVGRKPASPSRA